MKRNTSKLTHRQFIFFQSFHSKHLVAMGQESETSKLPLIFELIATDFVLIICVWVCTGIMLCVVRHKSKEVELEVRLLRIQLTDEMPNDRKNFEIVARHLQKHTFERFSLALN